MNTSTCKENDAGRNTTKILEATERLIQLKGLARVTTKEIARESGLSEGARYRHFEQKEEVFFEIMQTHLPIFLETLRAYPAGTEMVSENLEARELRQNERARVERVLKEVQCGLDGG